METSEEVLKKTAQIRTKSSKMTAIVAKSIAIIISRIIFDSNIG